jgi:hypothetical protein
MEPGRARGEALLATGDLIGQVEDLDRIEV